MAFGPASGGKIHNLMKGCCDYKSFKRNILRNILPETWLFKERSCQLIIANMLT